MQYPLLKQSIITPLLPLMDKQGVSMVARGIIPSARTEYGFLQLYYKNKRDLKARPATKNTNYLQMRDNYLKRSYRTGVNLYKSNGDPTRRHLSLIAWGFTPDVKKLQSYIKKNKLQNRNYSMYLGSLD